MKDSRTTSHYWLGILPVSPSCDKQENSELGTTIAVSDAIWLSSAA